MATGGAVDETALKTYYNTVMERLISRYLALAAILAGTGLPVAAEDLDSALEAQKKKAQHRVYSEQALMADRDLTVPRTETEEGRQLDKKLREMEATLDARTAPPVIMPNPRPAVIMPRPAEDKNWLTAAVLDDFQSASMTNETDNTWLSRELERQQGLKEKESLIRENELVDKLLRERTDLQRSSPELDRLKKYQLAPPDIFGGNNKNDNVPSYMTPHHGMPDPLAAVRRMPKRDKAAVPALFSPEAARIASALDKDPLRSTRPPSFNLNPGVPVRKSSSVFSYDRRNGSEPVPLTPVEMIRRSSPINRPNPFADDHMPEFKSSIWD